jgi:hypothetical protein
MSIKVLNIVLIVTGIASTSALAQTTCNGAATKHVRLCSVTRSANNPLITPATSSTLSNNIDGPSVIRVPSWIPNRLGNYYMYFAAHNGHYIRMAYANNPEGPWTIYAPGTLKDTEVAPFSNTISSPDVHVMDAAGKIRMYFSTDNYPGSTEQWSGVAESTDGIHFTLRSTVNIAKYYLRVFDWAGQFFGLAKGWSTAPAELGVSPDGIQRFNAIKTMSQGSVRHMAVLTKGTILLVFYSRIGDAPERIFLTTIDMTTPPSTWDFTNPIEVIRPATTYEGAGYAISPSVKGPATNVNQLRDPYVFEDGTNTYLYYTIAGESGIAVAKISYEMLTPNPNPTPTPSPSPTPTAGPIGLNSRVHTISVTKVYLNKPGGDGTGSQPANATGTVTNGPTTTSSGKYWFVNFDTGSDGWVLESSLK